MTDAVLHLLEGGFSQVRVLVVGDLSLERYVLGEAGPASPVPVLRNARQFARPGGAANVAMNAAGLGCETFLCGYWGPDGAQTELTALLEAGRVDTTGVVSSPLPTLSQTRLMTTAAELLRLEGASGGTQPPEEQVRLEARAVELAKKVHAVILSDHAGGTLTDELCAAVIRTARAASIPVFAQAGVGALSRYSGARLVLTGSVLAADAAGMQMQEHDIGLLAFAPGGQGIVLLGPEGSRYAADETLAASDLAPSGAGDAVIAALAASMVAGLEPAAAIELAALAARSVAGKLGTAPVVREELLPAAREPGTETV
jgi:D-beta-D-heptose 7-phosphate kinase/D-beta-D-heptose 1-phosphate adenosyltransferase